MSVDEMTAVEPKASTINMAKFDILIRFHGGHDLMLHLLLAIQSNSFEGRCLDGLCYIVQCI